LSQHVHTALTSSHPNPLITSSISIPATPSRLPDPNTESLRLAATNVAETAAISADVFQPIATGPVPKNIPSRDDHPLPPEGLAQTGTIETNKFYGNLFLGSQTQPVWTHPYSVWWPNGAGAEDAYGLAVTHITRSELNYATGNPPQYFINPTGIQDIVLSASELKAGTSLSGDSAGPFSVNVNLTPSGASDPAITFPLVQGQGFITGVYHDVQPLLQSGVGVSLFQYVKSTAGTYKYRVTLYNQLVWMVYITPDDASTVPVMTLQDSGNIIGPKNFSGTIQVALRPGLKKQETVYDSSAGVYATGASISASVSGTTGTYTLQYAKGGKKARTLLMFALPHHQESFDSVTSSKVTPIQLMTTTKGLAKSVLADSLTMVEPDLFTDVGFTPVASNPKLTKAARKAIRKAAALELSENIAVQTNLNSMYFAGKSLAKFASILVATKDVAKDAKTAAGGLVLLKQAFNRFTRNQQQVPLAYDEVYGGAVSTAAYATNDSLADFGNSYYNDHHFHYGYHVYTAAVIAYLDPSWLTKGNNKAWTEMLIRDYANPITTDPYFPFYRMFDWYHGHSWAQGLFESADGKNQESSSEDAFATYALIMWGLATGDANMKARAQLQLAVQKRALRNYYLLAEDNKVQPPRFIGNRAAGIIFENKIDHTTYFGNKIEYIEGIHMIPLSPVSAYTRDQDFCSQEWEQYFSGDLSGMEPGWRGILKANQAIFDPSASWEYFSAPNFDYSTLDNGASLTWYLAYAAQLGGALAKK
jgi:endo-1,3(4)-beta-glucanase